MSNSDESKANTGPLAGCRIVEFAANLTGPLAGQWLADQGAEVIKVEPPTGDQMRYVMAHRIGVTGMTAIFASLNRNKRSVRLDMKKPSAVEAFKELVKSADVVLQNYRPGVVESMGLGYDDLKRIKPDLIFVSVSGFGTEGPYAEQRTYDPVIQAVSGMMVAQRDPDNGIPSLVKTSIADKVTALVISQGITAALYARSKTGTGQHVQINMLNSVLSFLWPETMANNTWIGDDVKLGGSMTEARYIYKTKDHYLMAMCVSNGEWAALCNAVGRPELIDDPRFGQIGDRVLNAKAVNEELCATFLTKTTAEWLAILREADTVCAPLNSETDVHLDPHVQASGIVFETQHPHAGAYRQPRHAIDFEKTPAQFRRHAPMLGEHTAEVLREIGYSETTLETMRKEGAIK